VAYEIGIDTKLQKLQDHIFLQRHNSMHEKRVSNFILVIHNLGHFHRLQRYLCCTERETHEHLVPARRCPMQNRVALGITLAKIGAIPHEHNDSSVVIL